MFLLRSLPAPPSRTAPWRRRVVALAAALGVSLLTASVALASVPAFPLQMIVGGSTTVFPTADGVARGPYLANFPDVNIVGGVTQPGSGIGIQRLLCNQNDVATASRPLNIPNDDNATSVCAPPHPFSTSQVDQWVIGKDGITIIVHCDPTNCVTGVPGLTRADLNGIYACTTTNWQQLGGPNQQIVAVSRETTSGTYGDFMGFIGLNGPGQPAEGACVVRGQGNPGMVTATQSTNWSIAYVGFGFSSGSNLAILPVSNNTSPPNFVLPSVTTVENGTYPFARQLFEMTLKTSALPATGTRLDNYARAIDFVNTTAS